MEYTNEPIVSNENDYLVDFILYPTEVHINNIDRVVYSSKGVCLDTYKVTNKREIETVKLSISIQFALEMEQVKSDSEIYDDSDYADIRSDERKIFR